MDIGKSVGCAGSRVGLSVIVGVVVLEGEGEALGVVVAVGVDVNVAVGVAVSVGYGVGLSESVRVKLGLRVEACLGVFDGCRDAALTGCEAGGVDATCPQALKNKPRARKAKATPHILRMGNSPQKMLDCTA